MSRYNNDEGYLEKFCGRCKEWWPATTEFFYSNKSCNDGLYSWCIACYLEYRRSIYPPKGQPREFSDRNKNIVGMRDNGMGFAEIGKTYGISRQRVQQIYKVCVG